MEFTLSKDVRHGCIGLDVCEMEVLLRTWQ
jgi:hypothetical protein